MATLPPSLQLPSNVRADDRKRTARSDLGTGRSQMNNMSRRSHDSGSSGNASVASSVVVPKSSGVAAARIGPGPAAGGASLLLARAGDSKVMGSLLPKNPAGQTMTLAAGGRSQVKGGTTKPKPGGRARGKGKLDEMPVMKDGRDVTPLPLVHIPRAARGDLVDGRSFGGSHASGMSSAAMPMPADPHALGAITSFVKGDSMAAPQQADEPTETAEYFDVDGVRPFLNAPEVMLMRKLEEEEAFVSVKGPKRLTEDDLNKPVTIKLEETETFTLFHIPCIKVWGEDTKLAEQVTLENQRYTEMIDRHKEKDKFTNRGAQTFNNTVRNKGEYKVPEPTREVGTQATSWDIYDVNESEQHEEKQHDEEDGAEPLVQLRAQGAGSQQMQALEQKGGIAAGLGLGGGPTDRDRDGGSSGISPRQVSRSRLSGHSGSHLSSDKGGASHMSGAVLAGLAGLGLVAGAAGAIGPDGRPISVAGAADAAGAAGVQQQQHQQRHHLSARLLKSGALHKALAVVEQAVVQNELHDEQMLYRNHKEADSRLASQMRASDRPDSASTTASGGGRGAGRRPESASDLADGLAGGAGGAAGASGELKLAGVTASLAAAGREDKKKKQESYLVPLWSFDCALTKGLSVTCVTFNKQNQDLIAAGYGSTDFGKTTNGLILFWSLKNPKFPHKAIKTKHSVTSLDFGAEHPHLLSAGCYDGTVAIYDLSADLTDKPTFESTHKDGKHSEAVWGVKWVSKDPSKKDQQLMSISGDSTVQQWDMKKGLVPHELMQLKRMPNKASFITQLATGLCFDFPINDGTQYFAGTEDGIIHKCSVSYNEQTLENFFGHTGPVYKIRCSPFLPDAFLSCSADWTCALWSQKQQQPLLRFLSGHDYIMDVEWSPSNSCAFGSVSRDGRVEIWDLNFSPLDPVIVHQTKKELSCVVFSPNAPVILTGARDGSIDVYRMEGVDVTDFNVSHEDQAVRLADAMFEHNENKHQTAVSSATPRAPPSTQSIGEFTRTLAADLIATGSAPGTAQGGGGGAASGRSAAAAAAVGAAS